MLPITHFFPKNSVKYCRFKEDKLSLIESLNKVSDLIGLDIFDFNPYPLLFNKQLTYQLKDCHSLLIEAIHQIVIHFFKDPTLQQIISLSDEALNLLHPLKDKDYKIGAIRPDFLFDKNYNIKICEINARFPLNTFILSQYLYDAMYKKFSNEISCINKKSIKSIEMIKQFFNCEQPIHIFFDKEKSFDIFLLQNRLKKSPHDFILQLITSPKLLFKEKLLAQRMDNYFQAILNLQQEELFTLEPSLLNKITTHTYFNDIRTILIVHDKRLLSVLSDKAIMSNYLSSEKCDKLINYITPTYLLNAHTIQAIMTNPTIWVLKKTSSGKGEGMHVGKETQLKEFFTVLNEKKLDYIAQPFIEQPLFNLLNASSTNRHCGYQDMYLVGALLSFNNTLLGPGLLRGSHKTIINLAQGGTTLFTPLY